jgi:hypothetical protein
MFSHTITRMQTIDARRQGRRIGGIRRAAIVLALFALFALFAGSAHAGELRPRAVFPKPAHTTVDPERHSARQVVVKFHEGTHVRLREGRLVFDPGALTYEELARMERHGLTKKQVLIDVARANELLVDPARGTLTRVFTRSEDELAAERAGLEPAAGAELADLALYSVLVLDEPNRPLVERTIDALNALPSVEISYPEPLPAVPAADIAPTTTINVVPDQGYLRPAFQGGIDAQWAGRLPGGRGAGVRVVDIETGWYTDHEDLPATYLAAYGWNFSYGDHGTAVLGVLAAADNGYGATGIVPDVTVGISSTVYPKWDTPYGPAAAVDNAAAVLRRGDVMVIEQHYPEPTPPGAVCRDNCSQFDFLPAESVQAVFDVVQLATAKGIVVVEAAGNGSMNLDDPFYSNRFNRSTRDSGAILVGAGLPYYSRTAQVWTNFGSRVDLQGWGESVATLGYGDGVPPLQANGGDKRQWYTRSFSGTSSATPIVAGAAAAVNGSRLADGDPVLGSTQMRQLLRSTGTPQPAADAASMQIGPLPNLRAALPAVAGRLDGISADGVARGWAFHSAQPGSSIEVRFFVDGPMGSSSGAGSRTANTSWPGVNGAFGISGLHGFEHAIPDSFRDDSKHTLFVYGIDPTSRQRHRLLEQQLEFKLPNVKGTLDSIDANGRVRGWAYASQSPWQPISVQLYADGPRNGGGTLVGTYTADAPWPDVNTAFVVGGNHGFDIQLPASLRNQQHVLYVYGLDPRGVNDPLLGSGQFTFADTDLDGFPDGVDNCRTDANPSQDDLDKDGLGDACDSDDDNDGAPDTSDNCSQVANPNQEDIDRDGIGDACELPTLRLDNDGDGEWDATDPDDDNDGIADGADNCQFVANASQVDGDGDGVGTACDSDESLKPGDITDVNLRVRDEYFARFEKIEFPLVACLERTCVPGELAVEIKGEIALPARIVDHEGKVLAEAEAGLEQKLVVSIDSTIEGYDPEHPEPRYFVEFLRTPDFEPEREYGMTISVR